MKGEREHTKQTSQMLRAVGVQRTLACQVARAALPHIVEETELLALELVEQDFLEGLVEVLFDARSYFVEDVIICRCCAMRFFLADVLRDDAFHGVFSWQSNHLAVFGDVLPVIDQKRLQVVRKDQLDSGFGVEGLLLVELAMCSE